MCIILFSCSKRETVADNKTDVNEEEIEVVLVELTKDPRKIGPEKSAEQLAIDENIYEINQSENPLYGYWVGAFGKNKINIAISHIDENEASGHSVCAGNFREIKGTVEEIDQNIFAFDLNEPGDDPYDGHFFFQINLNTNTLTGTWKPFKPTVASKEYILKKREFQYDPNVGEYNLYSSTEPLSVEYVENLLPEEIEMIRNEIYARHGYSFKNLKIRRIFDTKEWYIPMAIDIRDQLTELEARNIDILYNYEEYYDEYYDDFGR